MYFLGTKLFIFWPCSIFQLPLQSHPHTYMSPEISPKYNYLLFFRHTDSFFHASPQLVLLFRIPFLSGFKFFKFKQLPSLQDRLKCLLPWWTFSNLPEDWLLQSHRIALWLCDVNYHCMFNLSGCVSPCIQYTLSSKDCVNLRKVHSGFSKKYY